MYRGRKQHFDWTFALKAGDLVSVLLSFPVAFLVWSIIAPDLSRPAADRVTALNCLFYTALILFILSETNLYTWRRFIYFPAIARRLPFALLASLLIFLAIHYMLSSPGNPAFLPFLLVHLWIAFLLILLGRLIVRAIVIRIGGISHERIAVVGWSTRVERVLQSMQKGMGQYQTTLGFVEVEPALDGQAKEHGLEPLGPMDKLETIIEEQRISILIVEEGQVSTAALSKIADECSDMMVHLKLIPSTFDIWANRLSVQVISGVPVMGINDLHHDRFGNRIMKRAVDVVGALVGLAISAPIIAIFGLLVYRESPGPIFYRQVRLGLHDKPFEMIKLRSMRLDAEQASGAVWTVENDPRRLKIGAFMRSWNIDELPQFWNVLKGDMSIVGPRPERPEFVKNFRDSVRYYNLRHTCKPGLTGWAAVHGLRGNTSLEDRLEYDLYYIANWGLVLDFQIILMTILPPKNAY